MKRAVDKCVDYPLDKSHKLNAYSFKTFSEAMATTEECVIPEEKFESVVCVLHVIAS